MTDIDITAATGDGSTTAELRDRAAELRKALAATEAEIEVREKVADWPTAPLIVASVDGGGPQLLSVLTTHSAATMSRISPRTDRRAGGVE